MPKVNVLLKRHVTALDAELGRNFPQVEKVEPLVVEALAIVESRTPSTSVLEITGLM